MQLNAEMDAFARQINLPLLTDIIGFVFETAEKDPAKQQEVWERCPLLDGRGSRGSFQEKYQFLYLGELLERYEERFGMTAPDRRAIALALGYTRNLTTREMFVGNQRVNFLQAVRRYAADDIYLIGALYLLSEGQSDEQVFAGKLMAVQYTKTEELLFVMSLFPDFERTVLHFKPQMLRLLGTDCTFPVFGNMQILSWLIGKMSPAVKKIRTKDAALLRALCALPTSFIKKGTKNHDLLRENGYSELEIAYANMAAVLYRPVDCSLPPDALAAEKIAVALFQEVLGYTGKLSDAAYAQLSLVFEYYQKFRIKCYESRELAEALQTGPCIQNADTFVWFTQYAPLGHHAFDAFDVTDSFWDGLAGRLAPSWYTSLFERGLNACQSAEDIRYRIARYNTLTGQDYIGGYAKDACRAQFPLLVEKGIIDLWEAFQNSLDVNGAVIYPKLLGHMKRYLNGIKTVQAFHFYRKFLPIYGFDGFRQYLQWYSNPFTTDLLQYDDGRRGAVVLKFHRDYLNGDEDGRRLLLHWVNEYVYLCEPKYYMDFMKAVLLDESVTSLLTQDDLRALFDIVAVQNGPSPELDELKRRYLTQEELQEEQRRKEAAAQERARKTQEDLQRKIKECYAEKVDGSFGSILAFMGDYRYRTYERPLAYEMICERLGESLRERSCKLSRPECIQFLQICLELANHNSISFESIQKYISLIEVKEADVNAA